jgi:hypothetical protein
VQPSKLPYKLKSISKINTLGEVLEFNKTDVTNESRVSVTVWIAAGAVILLSFFTLLWKIGLFSSNNSPPGADVIAAVLGLLGVIVTAVISLVGYFLKKSFDQHSLRLQQATEERLKQEGEQHRKRLEIETAIQAVGLMSTQAGMEAPVSQKSGALFALVTLDQLDLALALVNNMWPLAAIDTGTAVWVIDKALQSKIVRQQLDASSILRLNHKFLPTNESNFHWPECLYLDWKADMDVRARKAAVITLLKLLISKPKEQWLVESIADVIAILENAITAENDNDVKALAILGQNRLLHFFLEGYDDEATLLTSAGSTTLAQMKGNMKFFEEFEEHEEGIEAENMVSSDGKELIRQLEKWFTTEVQPKPPIPVN